LGLLEKKAPPKLVGMKKAWLSVRAGVGNFGSSHLAVLVPEKKHGDASAHDVKLGSLLLHEC
jgi:hypothetical protein